MAAPSLKDFWALHGGDKWDGNQYIAREPASENFVGVDQLGKGDTRHKKYLMIKDATTGQLWGVLIHTPDSWLEEYEELYVSGPVKMKATPRQITVYDYEVDNG